MYYTQRKRDKTSSRINLTNCNVTISTILVGLTICQLGVHFDYKLLYNYHVTKITVKAENVVVCISMLANTVQGISHYHLCLLYCTCILPIITYASAAQWTSKQKHIQIMNKVQNRVLHLICTVFCTTPTHALELEVSISPLSLYLDSLTRHAAIYFNKLILLIILSSNDYQITGTMNRIPQILLLSLLNTTAGPNQHNYKKQPHSSLQPMNIFLSFFSSHSKKHSWTMKNTLQFTNLLPIKTKQQLITTVLSTKHNTTQKHSLSTWMASKYPFSTDSTELDQQQQNTTREEKFSTENLALGAQLKFMMQRLQDL